MHRDSQLHVRWALPIALAFVPAVLGQPKLPSSSTPPPPLPALSCDGNVTVSGLSAGAFFAVQFHVAYSSTVQVLQGGEPDPAACCALVLRPSAAPSCCALVLRPSAAPWCCALVLRPSAAP